MVQLRIFIPYVLVIFLSLTAVFAQTTAPKANCEIKSNSTCEECLKEVSCLWCQTTQKCMHYPVQTILPPHSLCPLNDARWGLCWVNFQALIIAISVVAGVIIIGILICCFCCCKCENIGSKRFEAKMAKQSDKRKVNQAERKTEMKMRHEEIRKKYGLSGANPYSKFENN